MLVIDLECTNLDYGSALNPGNRILVVSWQEDSGAIRTFSGDIMQARAFWAALDRHEDVCAYNAKFEMHWLKRCGFDIDTKSWDDPMLAEKVLLGNHPTPKGYMTLGTVSERYGFGTKDPMIDSMMGAGVCPSDMPQKRLRARCVRDVRTTSQLLYKQLEILREQNQIHLYRNRCDFAVVLAHIEAEGMQLDPEKVSEFYSKYATEAADFSRQLDEMTGGINMNSPDQKADFLYRKLKFPEKRGAGSRALRNKPSKQFPDGRPKTDKHTIAWLAGQAKTELQKRFIEISSKYSKANAALTKNLEFFRGVCAEYNSKFHAQFNQTVAATHRLTSSGIPLSFEMYGGDSKSVQFQNMPREFKSCFKAPEGYFVAEVDAMQLEFRVAAFCGQDKQAFKDIADPNFDAHIFSASRINNRDYTGLLNEYRTGDKEAKSLRQDAKEHTFKPLYGGKKGTPGEEAYYKAFAERYAGIVAEQENWLAGIMHGSELVVPWGMRFKWDTYTNSRGIAMNKRTNKPVGPQVFNYPVQNLATAEIVPISIVALYRRCKEEGLDVKFVNSVHDSVICYIREDSVDSFRKAAQWAFTTAVYKHLKECYNIDLNVPLGCEIIVGTHWGMGEETIYDDAQRRAA